MDPLDAALAVLRDDGGPLHWTVIQDRALRAGLLDPFTTPDVRRALLGALNDAVRTGLVTRQDKGVYRIAGSGGGR